MQCSDWDFVQGGVDVVLVEKIVWRFEREYLPQVVLISSLHSATAYSSRAQMYASVKYVYIIKYCNKYLGMFEYNLPHLLHLMNTAK